MQRIRIHRPRARRECPWHEALPSDPRDPDVIRAKALVRAGDRASRRIASPADRHSRVRPVVLGGSWSSSSKGSQTGANVSRRQATSGDNQPRLVQLDGPSGHTQDCPATLRMRLKSGRSAVRPAPDHQFCSVIRSFRPLRGAKGVPPCCCLRSTATLHRRPP